MKTTIEANCLICRKRTGSVKFPLKETDPKWELLVDTVVERFGKEFPTQERIYSFVEVPAGTFKAEVKITCYESKISVKILKLLK